MAISIVTIYTIVSVVFVLAVRYFISLILPVVHSSAFEYIFNPSSLSYSHFHAFVTVFDTGFFV